MGRSYHDDRERRFRAQVSIDPRYALRMPNRVARGSTSLVFMVSVACSSHSSDAPGTDAAVRDGARDARVDTGVVHGEAGHGSDARATHDGGSPADAPAHNDSGLDGSRDFTADASAFFGASRCASAHVLLCDGFETGTLNTTVWTVNGTAPVIDGIHAARGTNALHITQNGNGSSYIQESMTFPVPNDTYFGRAFFWFAKLPTMSATGAPDGSAFDYAHWTIIAASGTDVEGQIRVSGQLSKGVNLFGVGTDNRVQDSGTGDWTISDNDPTGDPSPVPTGQWVCLEWMHDGAANETLFYWNDVEHPSLETTATKHGGNANPFILPQFTNVWLGWQEYQPTTEPFELWVDEVAIDTARVGCVL
jgi:hypothetical protein